MIEDSLAPAKASGGKVDAGPKSTPPRGPAPMPATEAPAEAGTVRSEHAPAPENYAAIPAAMREAKRWVTWQYEIRDAKRTKVPQTPGKGRAKSTDPATWVTFEEAVRAAEFYHGIGFVLGDGWIGIDWDHVRDPSTGAWTPGILEEIHSLETYAERSPSGTGAHAIVLGDAFPGTRSRAGDGPEFYASGRYFTVTGNHIEDTPEEVRTPPPGALEALYHRHIPMNEEIGRAPTAARVPRPTADPDLTDGEIVEKCQNAANAAKFNALWRGDTSGYQSGSEADLALCCILTFYTRDPAQLERLVRQSGRYREKWDRTDYVTRTIGTALQVCRETWSPGRRDVLKTYIRQKEDAAGPEQEPRSEAVPTGAPDATPGRDYSALSTVTKQGAVRLDYQAIADILIARYDPVTFQKQIWVYDDGLYRREQGEILSFVSEVARAVGFTAGITTVVREVTAYVSAYEIAAEYPFDRCPDALPVANGVLVLDWTTGRATLHPYAPEHRFTGKWPVVYDPDADPGPIHDQALSLYVDDDALPALYQLPAHAILHGCGYGPLKRSYILEGPTNGGKSTYLVNFLNAIFGESNISNASLQEIGTNRFVTGVLERKIINRCDDLADVPLANAGPFKRLTGGFSHDIERKHEREYIGRITAVHAFTCNAPPPVPENVAFDSAFWNRWIYLRCNNVFDVDPGFVRRTFTTENVAGAFNRILAMVFEIRRRGDLIYTQDPGEVKDTWQTAANPFEQFVSAEMMTAKEPARFDKGKLFRIFNNWCGQNEISPRKVPGTLTGFTQLIFGSGFKPARRGADRDRVYEAPKTWKPDSKYREWL